MMQSHQDVSPGRTMFVQVAGHRRPSAIRPLEMALDVLCEFGEILVVLVHEPMDDSGIRVSRLEVPRLDTGDQMAPFLVKTFGLVLNWR